MSLLSPTLLSCRFKTSDDHYRRKQNRHKRQAMIKAHHCGQMGASYVDRIRAEEIPDAETIGLYPAEGTMPADAEGILVLLHGCGVDASQSSTILLVEIDSDRLERNFPASIEPDSSRAPRCSGLRGLLRK